MSEILNLVRSGQGLHGEHVVDAHCHFGALSSNYVPHSTSDEIAANMRRVGIAHACVCSVPAGEIGDPFLHNRLVAEHCARHPGLLSGYVTVNTNYRGSILEQVRAGEAMGLTLGVKLHVYRQNYLVDDALLQPLFEYENARRGIVLNHNFGTPARMEWLLRAYPDIAFIEGHHNLSYAPLAAKYDNLYVCTCAELREGFIERMVGITGSEKIVMGSDFMALDTTFGFGVVAYARLSDEQKRNVLGLNMQRLIDRVKR